jgi:hypothetical protein
MQCMRCTYYSSTYLEYITLNAHRRRLKSPPPIPPLIRGNDGDAFIPIIFVAQKSNAPSGVTGWNQWNIERSL